MKILLVLALLVSCSSPRRVAPQRELPSVCRNTLQRDIHRDECR